MMEPPPSTPAGSASPRRASALAGLVILIVATVGAFLAGRLSDGDARTENRPSAAPAASPAGRASIWTCTMHPSIKRAGAGRCPICGMPLVQINAEQAEHGTVMLTEPARVRLGVKTAPVVRRRVVKEVRAIGRVQSNETALSTVTSRVDS